MFVWSRCLADDWSSGGQLAVVCLPTPHRFTKKEKSHVTWIKGCSILLQACMRFPVRSQPDMHALPAARSRVGVGAQMSSPDDPARHGPYPLQTCMQDSDSACRQVAGAHTGFRCQVKKAHLDPSRLQPSRQDCPPISLVLYHLAHQVTDSCMLSTQNPSKSHTTL